MNNLINYPLPLEEPWERAAMKELALIAHGLTQGEFPECFALAVRLHELAVDLNQLYGVGAKERDVIGKASESPPLYQP